MRQAWMMNRGLEGDAPRQLRPARHLLALAAVAALAAGVGCGGEERVADGEHYPDVDMIDNMEDGTQYILSDDGRIGLWYTYNDASPSGTQEPAIGFPMYRTRRPNGSPDPSSQVIPRDCGSGPFVGEQQCTFVARTWGTGQRGWGAGMGVDLNGEGGAKNPIDASMYGGIGFFVIGDVRMGNMRVNIEDVRTTPESADAADRRGISRCESYLPDGTPTGRCNDHYGYALTGVPKDKWRWVTLPFHCLTAQAFGYPSAPMSGGTPSENVLRRDAIVGIQFQVAGTDPADTGMGTGMVAPFDFSIDNLSFLDTNLASDTTPCPTAM